MGSGAEFAPTSDPRWLDLQSPTATINARAWSHPVYQASTSDPLRTVVSQQGTFQYRIPDSAVAAAPSDGDQHLHVIDPGRQFVDECWIAQRVASGDWTCVYHVRNDLRGSGILEGGVRAYGGSAIAGLIRTSELQSGAILHALAFAVPHSSMRQGPVWPANEQDGNSSDYAGHLPMGSFVAIPQTVNLDTLGLSSQGLVIARALRDYGAYLVDGSANFVFSAEPSAENLLPSARADINRIRNELRIVTNNTPSSPGGGGSPVAPPAPPI